MANEEDQPGYPDYERGQKKVDMGRHFAKISRHPLKRQKGSDAWNERANKLTASRTAAMLLLRGTMEKNRALRAKGHKNGAGPSK